ncbi:Inositol-1,4,5-trisphosphate 5-phosphatase 1 [Coemansia thaxteri]|nr:Inositol-1,4,5-trisphosphate 5-phosphatase 1 [Coemansia thaxteri]KAJ2467299.1 Inositol-1,4,5-trisphosphate 5-phosphatase 1 [Coemansia sp. RSA 2322]
MQAKRFFLYVKSQPRAVALVPVQAISDPDGTFLSISVRRGRNGEANDDVSVSITTESVATSLRHYSPLDIDAVYGCVGVLDYQNDTYIFLATRCQPVCNLTELNAGAENRPVFRMTQAVSLSLTDPMFDVHACLRACGRMPDDLMQGEIDVYGISNPCTPMMTFLESGAFFFSPEFDITRTIQSQRMRAIASDEPSVYDPDPKFQWNNSMLQVFTDYRMHMCSTAKRWELDNAGYALTLIQGVVDSFYADAQTRRGAAPGDAALAVYLISRSSSMRSGMRFLTRGVDDDGGVANEVETEVIVVTRSLTLSHVQIRGSIPVFWTQEGLQLGSHRLRITRSVKATLPATQRHFADLLCRYKRVNVVNLLKQHSAPTSNGGFESGDSAHAEHGPGASEAHLGQFYETIVEAMGLPAALTSYTAFDYHYEVRGGNFDRVQTLIRHIGSMLTSHQYYLADNESDSILALQRGVQRTNCLDCLDRTNVVQSVISRAMLSEFLRQNGIASESALDAAIEGIGQLWRTNGNAISRAYAGTGALKSDVTASGKSGWAGFFSDASKSLSRLMQNNFQDKGKQSVIDTLLGSGDSGLVSRPVLLYDPYEREIAADLGRELLKISRKDSIHVMLCTYNLHGNAYRGEPLGSWMAMPCNVRPDFVAIGFQEVVNLDVQSVIAADTTNRRTWEQVLTAELNSQYRKAFGTHVCGEYALVSSEQLVGVALLFFAHDTVFPRIHNVQMVKHKTGLSGMAGNKGCVAMHLMLDDTSICIVAAHLSSGTTNVAERNSDFHSIRNGTRFRRGMLIDEHDYVFWLGDLNYRIDLPNDQARMLIAERQLKSLLIYDQLSMQVASGKVFRGYSEAEIHFSPTYKYDDGTSNYDTSEKMRVPSWTDRILYSGNNVRALAYYCDEICLSDHKPVLAMIEFDVVSVDKTLKRQILRKLYARRHGLHADSASSSTNQPLKSTEQRLIDWDGAPDNGPSARAHLAAVRSNLHKSPAVSLPSPSSNSRAWWDVDQSADSNVDFQPSGASSVRSKRSGSTGRVFINPFASTMLAIASSTVAPGTQVRPAPQANFIDDPFADDLADMSWKPIIPS